MGILKQLTSEQKQTLAAHTLVGRGRVCSIVIPRRIVSSEHASLTWLASTGGPGWVLRDLASRNGTWLNDQRLDPGAPATLTTGSVVAFGDPEDRWSLIDDAPPIAMARRIPDGAVHLAEGGALLLPSSGDPEITVFHSGYGDWILEDDSGARTVQDQEILTATAGSWQLFLPQVVEGTVNSSALRPELMTLTLQLQVSRDEEHVKTTLHLGTQHFELEPRSYHYLLVLLARIRRDDADASEEEQGWIDAELLARQLAVTRRTLNVHICRLRQQIGQTGIDGAAGIIERRSGARQIRLGVAVFTVESL
ncbi:MAG: hypothetical protein ACI8RZ_001328 [Myxococcota bacterium]|jgi:hypothetical protein